MSANFRYSQTVGYIDRLTGDGSFRVGYGYSGDGPKFTEGRNNPAMESVKGKGPIPRGLWKISLPRTSKRVGPVAMDLTPIGHDAHGRTAFMIHGDNKANDASRGCIILMRPYREQIAEAVRAGNDVLEVVR